MDVNLGLFSERLKRILAGEEGTLWLPDAAKEHFHNLQTGIEFISSSLSFFQVDLALLLIENFRDNDVTSSDVWAILKEINCFVSASEEAIGMIIMSNMKQNGKSFSKEMSDALLGLESKINDIKQQMQQVQPQFNVDFGEWMRLFKGQILLNRQTDTVSLQDDAMEELLDQLIEGPLQLSVVAIINSVGFDMSAFAAEAYNSPYVKSYFDCYAWVSCYNVGFRNDIMKIVMPQTALSEIMDKDDETMKTALHYYLRNKRCLIVLDDVFSNEAWDILYDYILPDHHNGSRVLAICATVDIFKLCRMKNGEMIGLDSVPARPLRATYREWPFVLLYYGSKPLEQNDLETASQQVPFLFSCILELPLYLKVCYVYLSVLSQYSDISTKQLYQLWIAEGFISDNSEVTAEEYLKQLISRGIIKVKKRRAGGTIKICCIPFLTWVMLMKIAKCLEYSNSFMEGSEFEYSKRVSFIGTLTYFLSLEHTKTFLHSLLLHTIEPNHLVPPMLFNEICKRFKFLAVLNLGTIVFMDYPSEISNLFLLKFLKLNIPSLKCLPSSLCNLLNLLTIDMPSSYVEHTPDEIWKMKELRHLNFGLITLPTHSGKYCSSLANLNFISVLHPSSCTEDILGRLPSLQSVRIHENLSSYQHILSGSLYKLLCLESLKLVNESKIASQLSSIDLPEYQFPPGLIELSLSNTELRDDPMPVLEKLPHLQVLKLKKNSYFGRKLVCSSGGFPSLKVLHLKSMFWLEEWIMENEAIPKLESLIINPCAYLKMLPEELWRIKSFTKLEVRWPRFELRERLRKFEEKEKYHIQIFPYGM